jgi:hypothetical protein
MNKLKQKLFKLGIESAVEWAEKKGVSVEFDYCVQDEYRSADGLITINTRQGMENRLYALLHECGHLALDSNEALYSKRFPTSMKLAIKGNKALTRSKKYKVDTMAEEIDAWRKGRELAHRLDIYVDDEKYYNLQVECLYGYIQHLARFA